MSDLISRQEVLKLVDSGYLISNGNYQKVRKMVESLPSAEPEWTSVKERLPKDNVPVNITWINRNPEPYYKSIKDVPFTATGVYFKGKWYWYSSTVKDYLAEYGRAEWDEMAGCIEVTAWMPLPKPWKGEENE